MTNKHKMTNRLIVTILSLLMLFSAGPFFNADNANTYAADASNITTWAELKEAIEVDKATSVTITKNLYSDESINVTTPVTINGSGDNGVTIYQKERTTYDTMFKVTENGNLTLGEKLTLTGKTGTCSGGGGGNQTAFLNSNKGFLANTSVDDVRTSTTIGDQHKTIELEVKTVQNSMGQEIQRGFVKIKGKYIKSESSGSLVLTDTFNEAQATFITTTSGGEVTSFSENGKYFLYTRCTDSTYDGYIYYYEDYYQIVSGGNNAGALEWTASDVATGGGGDQTCDNNCPGDETYTKTSFPGGSSTEPKGFFVDVREGGKATLAGATLKNFITSRDKDTAPKHVAPVAVSGAGSTFDVTGGSIENNIVGYVAKDTKANESADKIKTYVKGAAPNAKRKNAPDRRRVDAGIDDGDKGSGVMATSGGIIYAAGAVGEISGGSIGFNRGDTGGIMASGEGTSVSLRPNPDSSKKGADINNNVGVQFGGGVTTEDGALITMYGGSINNNVAWFGGGAVFATQNGVEWLVGDQTKAQRNDGKFVMSGGVIEDNTAFTRGGGFLVDSNGVSLIKGIIRNNMSRMLGGGMYVMGDHPDYSYTVYINKGYVHDNKAVSEGGKGNVATDEDNKIVSRKLVAPNACDGVTKLFNGQMENSSDDQVDGYPAGQDGTDGTGGGIWLCAYGSTALGLQDNQFIIDHNYASGSVTRGKTTQPNKVYPEDGSSDKAGGNDIHKDTKASGNIVVTGIVNDKVKWYDENTNEWYTDPSKTDEKGSITDFGLKNLTNKGDNTPEGYSEQSYDGVNVYGNISRRGGGLAADGTFIFGEVNTIAEAYSELAVTKTWTGDLEPEDVYIRINLEYKDEDKDKIIQIVELPLSELVGDESELDTAFADGSTVNDDGETVYKGHVVLPITVEDENGKKIQVFDLLSDADGSLFELNKPAGLLALADHLENNGTVTLSNKDRKLTFVELKKDQETGELVEAGGYEITPTEMRLSTTRPPKIIREGIYQIQPDGTSDRVGWSLTSDIRFEADLLNDKPAEIEKYVNKAVHKEIALDEEFEYDILAYVKHGTDKLVLTDKLVDELDFVSKEADVKVVSLDANEHKPLHDINGKVIDENADADGVAQDGNPIDATKRTVEIDEKKLTVTIENELEEVKDAAGITIGYKNTANNQNLTELWGKWVKVTYKAKISQEIQDKINSGEMTLADLKSEYITVNADEKFKPEDSIYGKDKEGEEIYRPEPNVGNAPVESNEDHRGIVNTASYELEVKNSPEFKDESNTVTVKPEEPTVEKYVGQAVHKDIDLDEVFTYDIIGYISNSADMVEFVDQLADDLEFADPADVTVKYLSSNNHKPKYDIDGKEIDDNSDASVASKDWVDVDTSEGALTIDADKTTGKLTVTIDDLVETAPDGDVIDRQRQTVYNLRGKYVKVTFKAQIKKSIQEEIKAGTKSLADLSNVKVKADENDPILSEEAHNGIVNDANLKIEVGNKGKYDLWSNKVTVKPEMPEIEKYVNQAVHKDIDLSEVFTYDIMAYVTKDADKVLITDELNEDLQFVSKDSDTIVSDMGAENNHKPTNNVKAKKVNSDATVNEKGTELKDANVKIDGNVLTVEIPDATSVRGNWVRVRFQCKIKDGKTVADLKYTTINPTDEEDRAAPNIGNAPVESKEQHNGVPNKASYTIGVKNEAGIIEDKYSDESNTVTVKPEDEKSSGTPKLKIKKTSDAKNAKPGDEIPYTITLTNSGSADAKDVVITDTMDDNLTYISDDWDGINEGQTITWTVDVPAGMSLEINLLCRIDKDASGKVVNNVKLSNVKGEYVEVEKDNCEVVLPAYEGADTGDDTEVMPWMLLFIASVATVTTGAVYRRKRSR